MRDQAFHTINKGRQYHGLALVPYADIKQEWNECSHNTELRKSKLFKYGYKLSVEENEINKVFNIFGATMLVEEISHRVKVFLTHTLATA